MRTLVFCLSSLLATAVASAQEATTMVERSLFNGKDLSGWHGQRQFDPAKLAAMPADKRAKLLADDAASVAKHWSVENGEIVNDGAEMASTTLFAEIDTRDLNGGAFGEDVDVCIIVEQLGSECHACPDGVEACTELILELSPVEIDLDFDPSLSGGC